MSPVEVVTVEDQPPLTPSADTVELLELGLAGEVDQVVGVALRLHEDGAPICSVVVDLLAPAQVEVGERWSRNEVSLVEEHLATASAEAALHALAATLPTAGSTAHVVLACPEGEWHATAAHMFSVQLQARGVGVTFLGASTPLEEVARCLDQERPDALVVTCTLPIHFTGVTRLVNVAHALGTPVLAGGRALLDGADKVSRLGGDAWVPDVDAAVALLREWRQDPPPVSKQACVLPLSALQLELQADQLSTQVFQRLTDELREAPAGVRARLAPHRGDLALVVRFLAAAQKVGADAVFTDFVAWLSELQAARGRPSEALRTELEALIPLLRAFPQPFVDLLQRGAEQLDRAG